LLCGHRTSFKSKNIHRKVPSFRLRNETLISPKTFVVEIVMSAILNSDDTMISRCGMCIIPGQVIPYFPKTGQTARDSRWGARDKTGARDER